MPLHASQMKTHANESQKRSLDEQLASGIQLPVVEGMTPQQVQTRIRHEKQRHSPRHQPAFPAAVEDDSVDELQPLRLEYDSWTSMLPDKSTPPQAETDLPLGRARIPANWSLQLVLYVATCVCVQRAASHSLTLLNPRNKINALDPSPGPRRHVHGHGVSGVHGH